MRIKPVLACFIGLLVSSHVSQGQSISVNNYTGMPLAAIPLYTMSTGQLSVPVTLVYSGSGVRVKDVDGTAGIGWALAAGGQVTRELRGLPDDNPVADVGRVGWIYNTNGTKVNNFSIANDGSTAVCTDETQDINYLNTNFTDYSDTEPDIFHVNAPGLSCDLVFDADHNIKVMPYQDLKVSYSFDGNSRIGSFYIINDQGVSYNFSETEYTNLRTIAETLPAYNKRFYNQFSGGVTYYHSWKLSSMTDPLGNTMSFGYGTAGFNSTDYASLKLASGNGAAIKQYSVKFDNQMKCLTRITTYNGDAPATTLKFWYGSVLPDGEPEDNIMQDGGLGSPLIRNIVGFGRAVSLTYKKPVNPGSTSNYLRHYLKDVQIRRSEKFGAKSVKYTDLLDEYTFGYYGMSASGGTLAMPDSTSKAQDLWGYYNGTSDTTSLVPKLYVNPSNSSLERYRTYSPGAASASYPYVLTGSDRAVNPLTVANGMLKNITNINAGSTTLVYEPNDFYDPTAQAVQKGAGVRVKQTIRYDGIDSARNMVTNYNYLTPSTGLSSGRIVTMPAYAFTTPYTGSGTTEAKWGASTIRSETDLSTTDNSVLYGYVRVSAGGTGSILSCYSITAMNWDATISPDWTPTIEYIARIGCGTATFATNDKRTYPFAPDINYGFERGMPLSVTAYNETGQKVTETIYHYKRSYNTPVIVNGLKFEDNTSSARSYSKYSIFTATSKLLDTTVTKTYDLNDTSKYQTAELINAFASPYHKLPTSTKTTRSDGSVQTSFVKYVKDYSPVTSTDTAANALYILQQGNQNLPVETYTQITRNGSTRTVSGQLSKFKPYTFSILVALPSQQLSFVSPAGLSNFQPSGITSGVFNNDSRYIIRQNNLAYNLSGTPMAYNNNRHQVITEIIDDVTLQPVAQVKGAGVDEIGFSDFDYLTGTGPKFTTDTAKVTGGHSGWYAKAMAGKTLTRMLKKSSRATNYVFSAWVTGSDLTLTLTNSSNQSYTYTLPGNTGSDYVYKSISVPVTNMSSIFTAVITTTGISSVDDVWLYPDYAQVSTAGYNPETQQKTSETNTNGVSTYYDYEGRGRLSHIYDQDKNIVQKKSYVTKESYQYFLTPAISLPNPGNYNNQSIFADTSGYSLINTYGIRYTWNFGDGTANVVSSDPNGQVAHKYTAAGNYSVSVTKNSPFYGIKSASRTVAVADSSSQLVNIYISNLSGTNGTITSMEFYKNGVLRYSFTGSGLLTGTATVSQGKYDVRVYTSGQVYNTTTGKGFRSIQCLLKVIGGGTDNRCSSYSGTSPIPFNGFDFNGLSTVYFNVSTNECIIE